MKQVVNFRLNSKAISVLSLLEEKLHTSKTSVVEMALLEFAKKNLIKQNNLLEFAGVLSDSEADNMLSDIKTSKHNKKKEIKW